MLRTVGAGSRTDRRAYRSAGCRLSQGPVGCRTSCRSADCRAVTVCPVGSGVHRAGSVLDPQLFFSVRLHYRVLSDLWRITSGRGDRWGAFRSFRGSRFGHAKSADAKSVGGRFSDALSGNRSNRLRRSLRGCFAAYSEWRPSCHFCPIPSGRANLRSGCRRRVQLGAPGGGLTPGHADVASRPSGGGRGEAWGGGSAEECDRGLCRSCARFVRRRVRRRALCPDMRMPDRWRRGMHQRPGF